MDLTAKEKAELEAISKRLDYWQGAPRVYMTEVIGVAATWKLQNELMDAIPVAMAEHKIIYIGSGHALGKDYILAGIGLWFLQTFRPSIVIETAPTERQVKSVMWKETTTHWNNRLLDLGGTIFTEPRLDIASDWYMLGFTTKETGATKEGGGGKFTGYHSPNICVLVTEAQAIEDSIYDQIDALATSENVLVIYAGNPTRAKGRFAAGLKDKKNNIVFNFSCLENPNYLQRKTVIPGLASYEWVEDKRRKWGEDDPRWIGRVLGQVPDTAVNNTFLGSLISHMRERCGFLAMSSLNAGVAVDPAGEGVDDNVFMSGKGGDVKKVFTKTSMSPSDMAHKAVKMCKEVDGTFIIVDCDGIGIGCWKELDNFDDGYLQGIRIIKFHGSAPSSVMEHKKAVYQNCRSEASFVTRELGQGGKASLPNDAELIEDLSEEEFFENKRGLIQIELKEDLKDRLKRSPGKGDAYKMLQFGLSKNYQRRTSFMSKVFGYGGVGGVGGVKAVTEYDILKH